MGLATTTQALATTTQALASLDHTVVPELVDVLVAIKMHQLTASEVLLSSC